MKRERPGSDPTFDEARCERLLASVCSTSDPPWRELVGLLWPEVMRRVRASRTMTVLSGSEDHVRNVVVLVLERLGRDDCRASRMAGEWCRSHPDKTVGDWLRIVTTNVARDYVRERAGRAGRDEAGGAAVDKRLLHSLATLLPSDDELPLGSMLSATSTHAAHELAAWAEGRLPADQLAALGAWLRGERFEDMAPDLGLDDGASAKRLVRAAIAALRRHASAA